MSDSAEKPSATRWDAPALDGASDAGFLTASRLEELQKQAYDEAHELGLKEGRQSGEDEVRRRVDRFDQLLIALSRPFDQLDESVEKQLVELAMTVVRHLFRR